MDVRTENRGRPHQEVRSSAAPVLRRNFLTPGHPGARVGNVRGKSGPKSLCLSLVFFTEEELIKGGPWASTAQRASEPRADAPMRS